MTVASFFWSWFDLRIRVVPNGLLCGSSPDLDADKTLCAVTAQLGWSDPTHYFGHGNVHKSGVAPAQSGVLSAPKSIIVPCATSCAVDASKNPKVNRKVTDRVNCVFHAPFTLRRGVRTKDTQRRRARISLRV